MKYAASFLALFCFVLAGYAQPNIVIILTDDQGYADVGVYGAEGFETPSIDRMAAEGLMLTDFYAAPVCTPSRSALMTGSYPKRIGHAFRVIFPYHKIGLNPDEVTIADMLKKQGYATTAIGKWHLGHETPFLPTRQGFDSYFGIPYSNDMGNHFYGGSERARQWGASADYTSPGVPVMRDEDVIESNPDQRYLTKRFTEEALEFIEANQDQPFFLYVAHSMPHVPIVASEDFAGKSEHGVWGDVIEEIDWSVGQILDKLEALDLDENTLVVFTSDNGPREWEGEEWGWVWTADDDGKPTRAQEGYRYRSGSAGPLRGTKGTTWEGGMRVPAVMRWPAKIPAGIKSSAVTSSMDLFPTIAAIVGAPLPEGKIIDGKDIRPILFGEPGAQSPYVAFYYYRDDRLEAVRSGRWKLHVYRPEWGLDNFMTAPGLLLYDLHTDIGETTNVADQHPDIVRQLLALANDARHDMGDAVTGQPGINVHPVGRLDE